MIKRLSNPVVVFQRRVLYSRQKGGLAIFSPNIAKEATHHIEARLYQTLSKDVLDTSQRVHVLVAHWLRHELSMFLRGGRHICNTTGLIRYSQTRFCKAVYNEHDIYRHTCLVVIDSKEVLNKTDNTGLHLDISSVENIHVHDVQK